MSNLDPFAVAGASVVREGRPVLDGVDFTCGAGDFVALLGPNGAGKTTLVNVLLGLIHLDAGSVEVFGTTPRRFRNWSAVGYVPQRPAAIPAVPATLLEVTLLGRMASRRLRPRWTRADVDAAHRALGTVGLADRADDRAGSLSGGQQQRLRVARALVGDPQVLVLDEPFSWVDVSTEADLVHTLAAFKDAGRAIIFVAHDLHAVEHLVDRVVVLREGRVATQGRPDEVQVDLVEHRHEHEPWESR